MNSTYFSDHPAAVIILGLLIVWDLVWRGLALWRAGRNNQLAWFVVLLVVNTVGILPIVYLLISKPEKAND